MALLDGTKLGHYEIGGLLGVGGMGEVYRAFDPRLEREVAVKILPASLASDTDRLRRFRTEALTASKLNHPNIVHIYDVGEEELGEKGPGSALHYVAMELIEGKTFESMIGEGPLSFERLEPLARQVLQGLSKAHAAGIVHRDLKPANLMVTDDGYVKILDFGLAKQLAWSDADSSLGTLAASSTQPGMALGTLGYMSPEQARGAPADHRSDQFSLGALLYEMASGSAPFARDSPAESLAALLQETPRHLGELGTDLPPSLCTMVMRCLAKAPDERYPTTAELLARFDAATGRDVSGSAATGSANARPLAGDPVEAPRRHLPTPRTSFVGRDDELHALAAMVGPRSLVTLVGPGGIGKTRLALAHASSTQGDSEGIWFVDLSDTRQDDMVAEAVLTALGLSAEGLGEQAATAAAEKLASWRAILILDNCEQVVEGAAEMAEEILDRCPDIAILATSREPLAVEGEQQLRVTGLGAGQHDERSDGCRLFLERLRLSAPELEPSPEELATVTQLCADLDHLPLAIELAAARAGQLGLNHLIEGLLSGTPDRRQRRRKKRHRSLREVVRWSLDLMTDAERTVFRRLSVFDGGFTIDAVQAVIGGNGVDPAIVTEVLGALVDQSMVEPRKLSHGIRYRLLVTIRAQAAEELGSAGETATTRDRHLAWCRTWSRKMALSPEVIWWFASPIELKNQRAALRHAMSKGEITEAAELLSDTLTTFCLAGANDEAKRLYDKLRAACGDSSERTAVRLDMCEMFLAEINGDFAASHRIARRISVTTDEDAVWYGAMLIMAHHLDAVNPLEALVLYDEVDTRLGPSPMTAYGRGEAAITQGRFQDAAEMILRALAVEDVQSIPSSTPEAPLDIGVLGDLAVALDFSGRADEAHVVIDALADAVAADAPSYACLVPLLRAVVGSARAPVAETVALLREAAELERQWPEPVMAFDCLGAAAIATVRLGRFDLAARAYAAIHGRPNRLIGTHAWRIAARSRVQEELTEDERKELTELGKGDEPRAGLEYLLAALEE